MKTVGEKGHFFGFSGKKRLFSIFGCENGQRLRVFCVATGNLEETVFLWVWLVLFSTFFEIC